MAAKPGKNQIRVIRTAISALSIVDWKLFRVSRFCCPLCNRKRFFVRLDDNEISVRCLSCRATPITTSLASVLRDSSPNLGSKDVYELSSRGALFEYLRRSCKTVTHSEYFSDTPPGEFRNGIQCQDVQQLTYQDASFDLCTSTEVFEHIPNDAKGFSEIFRVLKPNGIFIFTVPIDIRNKTVERAELQAGGDIRHIHPPEYHSDPIRDHGPILVFRDYGYDVLQRLLKAGFKRAELRNPEHCSPWGYPRTVVVAYRENTHRSERSNSDPLLVRFAEVDQGIR